ncbi:hypothetical protein BV898_09279 [Hypsibius exemplaris]|uniref:G-protein coupled receptors family 1 profile domain-containing protein n=1 Tax=Hypsibius exemplaris TaxID=2072580 RepID=A0A1W0WN46_HYPEX|nr:hypothetical protein BV898_09279 [Hypsibius exemplaris]
MGMAPGVVNDAFYYRGPLNGPGGCQPNFDAQPKWAATVEVVYFLWPQVVMVLAMVVIFAAKRNRRRQVMVAHRGTVAGVVPSLGTNHSQRAENMNSAVKTAEVKTTGVSAPVSQVVPTDLRVGNGAQGRRAARGDLLLILLTISVTICWTPNSVFFTWLLFNILDEPVFYAVSTIFLAVQSTVDSILFALALKELREALRRHFCHHL